MIVTSNKPFDRRDEVFGNASTWLVHHASVVSLKGDRYRLNDRNLGRAPTDAVA